MAQEGAAPAKKAATRLTDLRVTEASIVDTPAILEGFYLTKALAKQVKSMGTETETPTAEAGATKATDVTDASTPPPPPADAIDPETPAPVAFAMPQAAKDAILDALTQSIGGLSKIAELVKAAGVDEGASVPPEIASAIGQVAEMLESVEEAYDGSLPTADGEPAPQAEAAPPPSIDSTKAMVQDALMANCSKRLADKVAKSFILSGMGGAVEVSKVGRKLSKARLTTLKGVVSLLAAMVKEVDDDAGGDADVEQAATPAPPPPPAASAPAAPAKPKPPPPAPAPVPAVPTQKAASSNVPPEVAAALSAVSKSLETLNTSMAGQQSVFALVAKALSANGAPSAAAAPPTNANPDDGLRPVTKNNKPVWKPGGDLAAEVVAEEAAKAAQAQARR